MVVGRVSDLVRVCYGRSMALFWIMFMFSVLVKLMVMLYCVNWVSVWCVVSLVAVVCCLVGVVRIECLWFGDAWVSEGCCFGYCGCVG